jgi:hypothetical protein
LPARTYFRFNPILSGRLASALDAAKEDDLKSYADAARNYCNERIVRDEIQRVADILAGRATTADAESAAAEEEAGEMEYLRSSATDQSEPTQAQQQAVAAVAKEAAETNSTSRVAEKLRSAATYFQKLSLRRTPKPQHANAAINAAKASH